MPTAIHRRVELCKSGECPQLVAQVPSGFVILADKQVLRGYCLLLPDPVPIHLNALQGAARGQFLSDMAKLGDALLAVTGAVRINYEMLGNLDPALHAHVIPRYENEPENLRTKPIWSYDWDAAPAFSESEHGELREAIKRELSAIDFR
jgi:diadenosine tetraphosphate (Ap4A) HIT family hydrolase